MWWIIIIALVVIGGLAFWTMSDKEKEGELSQSEAPEAPAEPEVPEAPVNEPEAPVITPEEDPVIVEEAPSEDADKHPGM